MSETLEPALPDHLDEQAERLMRRVCDAGLTISTAESCTGGMLAALLTDIEGAGHGFMGGQAGAGGANLKAAQQSWPLVVQFLTKHLQ